ncbi:MAG: THUMP domain-containing protein [Candidatus Hadarchaeales archaeon]
MPDTFRLMFLLSGEHPTLPQAEIRGAIKAEGGSYEILEELDQVLVLETDLRPQRVAERLSLSREVCQFLGISNSDEVLETLASSDLPDLLPAGKTFAVRVERIKGSCPEVERAKLEREVADLLLSELDLRVDLEHPEIEIVGVLTNGKCCLGLKVAETARRSLRSRRPSARAAFHPSTLPPTMARCMVNLSRAPRGGVLCDPFCGVGGILVEAGLMGIKPIGIDIDPQMVEGARKNLEFYGIRDFEVRVGDARELPEMEVDAVVTDPPFGIQSSTGGLGVEELVGAALPQISKILKRKGLACLSTPDWLDIGKKAEEVGLSVLEVHEQYVHRGLTRRIYVLKKTG